MYETRAKAQRSEAPTGRLSGRRGLARVVRVFSRSNKQNAAVVPLLPAKVDDSNVHTMPHIQPGVKLYPSVMNFAGFIVELHRSSNHYPSQEQLQKSPAVVFQEKAPSIALPTGPRDVELPLRVSRKRFERIVKESESREKAAKATEDLRNLLREIYLADGEGEASEMELLEEPSTSRSQRRRDTPRSRWPNAIRWAANLREFPDKEHQPLSRFLSQANRGDFQTCP